MYYNSTTYEEPQGHIHKSNFSSEEERRLEQTSLKNYIEKGIEAIKNGKDIEYKQIFTGDVEEGFLFETCKWSPELKNRQLRYFLATRIINEKSFMIREIDTTNNKPFNIHFDAKIKDSVGCYGGLDFSCDLFLHKPSFIENSNEFKAHKDKKGLFYGNIEVDGVLKKRRIYCRYGWKSVSDLE